jgi:hypothetical protein
MGFTDIDGLRIHYHAVGDPAQHKGQRVLYVHGTGCNTRMGTAYDSAGRGAHTGGH